jgi:excinuclease ABC subunit A
MSPGSSEERDMAEQKFIEIRGAREHNLKSVDVDIPRDKLVVITGCRARASPASRSTRSTPRGQRRYVESLSAYARQFLDMMQKPDVDHITASARRSPSSRRRPPRTRAPPSAP